MTFTAEEFAAEKARRKAAHDAWFRANKPAQHSRGLGDVVASIAQPIARAIDKVAGTKIAECGGCKRRREALNRIVPNL